MGAKTGLQLFLQGKLTKENAEFLNTNFLPEMITELFEGWVKVDGYNGVFAYKWDEQCSIINAEHTLIVDDTYITINASKFFLPKTIDSFKTLLKEQAGISLNEKPEILNKYFK